MGEFARHLAPIRAARTPEDRMRATMNLANTLPVDGFAAWIDGGRFSPRDGMDLMIFTNLLKERWQNEAPESFFLWAMKQDNGDDEKLRATWARSEPDRLLALFEKHHDDSLEIRVLSQIAEFHPDLALRRFQEMLAAGLSGEGSEYISDLVDQLSRSSPNALEAALDSLPMDRGVRFEAESHLIGQKMLTSFTDEIDKLRERPDGLKLLISILGRDDNNASRSLGLIDELGEFPASWRRALVESGHYFMGSRSAMKWFAADLEGHGFDGKEASKVRLSALYFMPAEDTLRQMASIELSTEDRRNVLSRIFRNLRGGNEDEYHSMLSMVAKDEDRDFISKSFQTLKATVPNAPTIETPSEWLAAFEKDSVRFENHIWVIRQWDSEKLDILTQQFDNLPSERKIKLATALVVNGSSPLRGDATAYLIGQPWDATQLRDAYSFNQSEEATSEELKAELASDYVCGMAEQDPEGAGRWISALPNGTPKLWAVRNLHTLWKEYDPAAADGWMKSLPIATQSQVKSLGTR
ncbi:hypothetical protein [Luteolibacter yonseiensis]